MICATQPRDNKQPLLWTEGKHPNQARKFTFLETGISFSRFDCKHREWWTSMFGDRCFPNARRICLEVLSRFSMERIQDVDW